MSAPASADRASTKPVAGRDLRRLRKGETCAACNRPAPGHGCAALGSGGVLCFHAASDQPSPNGGGWLHWPDGRPDDWRDRIRALPPPPPRPVLDEVLIDRAYALLLDRCPPSAEHRADLIARPGLWLTDEEVETGTCGYRFGSLPADRDGLARLAAAVAGELETDLVGTVPGWVRRGGVVTLNTAPGGLLIGAPAMNGRIAAVRVRTAEGYRYLSGGQEWGGVSVPSGTVSVAMPDVPRDEHHYAVACEGEFKAIAVCRRWGVPVVCFPGINTTQNVAAAVGDLGIDRVIMAVDADSATNGLVMLGKRALARSLVAAGLQVGDWSWALAGGRTKGIDDLLAAGLFPFPVPWLDDEAETIAPTSVPAASAPEVPTLLERVRRQDNREAIRTNSALGAVRHTAAFVAQELTDREPQRPGSPFGLRLFIEGAAERIGSAPSTVGEHVRRMAEDYTLPDGVCRRFDLEPGTKMLYRMVDHSTADGTKAVYIGSPIPREHIMEVWGKLQPGGVKQQGGCRNHPDAGTVEARQITARAVTKCADGGEVLASKTLRVYEEPGALLRLADGKLVDPFTGKLVKHPTPNLPGGPDEAAADQEPTPNLPDLRLTEGSEQEEREQVEGEEEPIPNLAVGSSGWVDAGLDDGPPAAGWTADDRDEAPDDGPPDALAVGPAERNVWIVR